ncbi:hypothetical protein EVAR_54504_1 [Eumeta japonica]|uniref:Uncharacterized protein n=1 Tax=Eumeta variegata TaxID=151549 RepID=A0A4C1YGB2_EUMVA|nr:hypothetical protein EVAR_54504_1 [Eumeta japonica]
MHDGVKSGERTAGTLTHQTKRLYSMRAWCCTDRADALRCRSRVDHRRGPTAVIQCVGVRLSRGLAREEPAAGTRGRDRFVVVRTRRSARTPMLPDLRDGWAESTIRNPGAGAAPDVDLSRNRIVVSPGRLAGGVTSWGMKNKTTTPTRETDLGVRADARTCDSAAASRRAAAPRAVSVWGDLSAKKYTPSVEPYGPGVV